MTDCNELGESMRRCLVVASDVPPNALQRKEIGDVVKRSGTEKVAVLTESRAAWAAVTGLGWITGVHKGFLPTQVPALLAFLDVPTGPGDRTLEAAAELAQQLGNPLSRCLMADKQLTEAG
jgi:hypothetical protein